MKNTEQILHEILRAIQQVEPTAEVRLFGSQARGDAQESSDWDVLILLNHEADFFLKRQIRDALFLIELEYAIVINSFVYSKSFYAKRINSNPLFLAIEKDGFMLT